MQTWIKAAKAQGLKAATADLPLVAIPHEGLTLDPATITGVLTVKGDNLITASNIQPHEYKPIHEYGSIKHVMEQLKILGLMVKAVETSHMASHMPEVKLTLIASGTIPSKQALKDLSNWTYDQHGY
jgi:hypothetical protein